MPEIRVNQPCLKSESISCDCIQNERRHRLMLTRLASDPAHISLSIYLPTYLPTYLSTYPTTFTDVYESFCGPYYTLLHRGPRNRQSLATVSDSDASRKLLGRDSDVTRT